MPDDTKNDNMPQMKSYLILVTGALLALVSCSQTAPYGVGPTLTRLTPKESPTTRQYMARPGQGVIDTHSSDPDEAFEAQVEAYTGQTATDPNANGFVFSVGGATSDAQISNTFEHTVNATGVYGVSVTSVGMVFDEEYVYYIKGGVQYGSNYCR